MAEMRQAPRHDWRRGWLGPFLVFLAMLLLTLWWLGVFNSPTVTEEMGVARSYVYQPFQGSYRQMVKTREKMAKDAPADLRSHTEITLLEREQGSGGDTGSGGSSGLSGERWCPGTGGLAGRAMACTACRPGAGGC